MQQGRRPFGTPTLAPVAGAGPARPEDERKQNAERTDDEQDVADRVMLNPDVSTWIAHARIAPTAIKINPTPKPIVPPPFRIGYQ
jgi:hypothetical protein